MTECICEHEGQEPCYCCGNKEEVCKDCGCSMSAHRSEVDIDSRTIESWCSCCTECRGEDKPAVPDVLDLSIRAANLINHNSTESSGPIVAKCLDILELLLEKNAAYGNSALEPVRVFSKATAEEQLLVRLDDKISRIVRGKEAGEDVLLDLVGYLVLLLISREENK